MNEDKVIVDYLENEIENWTNKARKYYNDYQYYTLSLKLRKALQSALKERSLYKRTLKKYKRQCELIEIEKYKQMIISVKKNPIEFWEKFHGLKLYPYQKLYLKALMITKRGRS